MNATRQGCALRKDQIDTAGNDKMDTTLRASSTWRSLRQTKDRIDTAELHDDEDDDDDEAGGGGGCGGVCGEPCRAARHMTHVRVGWVDFAKEKRVFVNCI